ncbi:MAG: GH3 auxin-responsive promoter family protein [Segetibacter sp.]
MRLPENNVRHQQAKVLKRLLRKARFTEFGQKFRFDEILMSRDLCKNFQKLVPVNDYNRIYKFPRVLKGKMLEEWQWFLQGLQVTK